jgi:glycosyltransferase involved in cell wall biosynthesis
MISLLILTRNEANDLPGCLQSLEWCDDIHVFDSFSTDGTVEIASRSGAKVHQRVFDNYASQRNNALSLDFKYDWIFILDADERFTTELSVIVHQAVEKATPETNAFRFRRRDYLGKTWLKHAQLSPFYTRLVRRGKAYYHREVNEVLEVDGGVKNIDGYFLHYPFSKGYSHWLHKHNQYSGMEAQRWIQEKNGDVEFSFKTAIFNKDFSKRRYHQKGLFYKFPGRPVIKWLYMIFWRRAFLDGRAGITYATLQSIYEYFIVLKARELLEKNKDK